MKFESKEQRTPTFEAKGLETIRRDQCALTQKILRNSLVALFQSGICAVKDYLFRQWSMILSGEIPVSDYILTGRVRSRYRNGRVGPVQASLHSRLTEQDPGRAVRHKERLAYIIAAVPGSTFRLRDAVCTPMELLEQWDQRIVHTAYYIQKHVNAALQRCLGLRPHKVDVSLWYSSCPKPKRRPHHWPQRKMGGTLNSFTISTLCKICGKKCKEGSRTPICPSCRRDESDSIAIAMRRLNIVQTESLALARKCNSCNLCFEDASTFAIDQGAGRGVLTPLANCVCIDCPITFLRHRVRGNEIEATEICQVLAALDG
jgi:DNA polymerase zeta